MTAHAKSGFHDVLVNIIRNKNPPIQGNECMPFNKVSLYVSVR